MRFLFPRALAVALCLGLGAVGSLNAGPATGTQQSSQLYTAPDPAATGAIRGQVSLGTKPPRGVFAQAVDNWKQVYRATLAADGRSFAFTGLPVGRYDLLILGPDVVWEGMTLTRGEDSLTAADRDAVAAAARTITPFFDTKRLERVEGAGGDDGKARAVLQEVRTRPVTLQSAEVRRDIQVRSIKLALLERVGRPGWAVVHTREFSRQEVGSGETQGLLEHRYVPALGGIRVLEETKDLGVLALP